MRLSLSTLCSLLGFCLLAGTPAIAEDDKSKSNDSNLDVRQLINEAKYHEIYGRIDLRNRALNKAEEIAGCEHASIQSMRGKINDGVAWRTPEEIAKLTLKDQLHQEYLAQRDLAKDDFNGQMLIADWCRKKGLERQTVAHLNRALWHNPNHRGVRQLLGHREVNDRWVTPKQMLAEVTQLLITQKRLDAWREEIREIRKLINNPSQTKREKGLAKLKEIKDGSSVPALELMLANHSPEVSKAVIKKFAQFEEIEASLALTRLSTESPWYSCRQMATKALASKNKYDYVPTLLSQLVSPVISRVTVIPGARQQVLYRHVYFQKRMDSDVIKQYDTVYQRFTSGLTNGRDSIRQTMRDIRRNAPMNERMKERQNVSIEQNNKRITSVLNEAVGINLGDDIEAWWKWWNDYNEVFTESRPIDYDRYQRNVEVYDRDLLAPTGPLLAGSGNRTGGARTGGGSCECLVAGTKIWTDRGAISVESIKVGDQVLSQNVETGSLEYKMVLRPTIRPETKTVTIRLSNETIQCSGGHPFWVAGQGWVKARDLKVGLPLNCAGGIAIIRDIKTGEPAKLYNLVVEGNANYFVGKSRILSHDNTIPAPTLRRVPGMAN